MCYVEISWMMRPGINFRFSGLIFPHFGKTATAAILETKWRMLWPRKFKAHVLSWNQLNEATRYQLPVFWLDFSEFRKKPRWPPSWIQNGGFYDSENSRTMCYVEVSWVMRPGINVLFWAWFYRFSEKTAMAAIVDSKWQMLWFWNFKDHVLRRNQLNLSTRYPLAVFWLDFSEFRKNGPGRHLGFRMDHIMTQKNQGTCAKLKPIESGDHFRFSG